MLDQLLGNGSLDGSGLPVGLNTRMVKKLKRPREQSVMRRRVAVREGAL